MIDNIYNLTQNMDADYRLKMAAVAILVIACMIIISLIWLLLRGIKLWYWKVDMRIEILQDIDRGVQEIRNALNERTVIIRRDEQLIRTRAPVLSHEIKGANVERRQTPIKKFQNIDCGISKSGRIYTQDELELQIKD